MTLCLLVFTVLINLWLTLQGDGKQMGNSLVCANKGYVNLTETDQCVSSIARFPKAEIPDLISRSGH